MNSDYRISTEFYTDTRRMKLERRLGESGVMALVLLWCWTAINCVSGIFRDMDEEDIEIAAQWHGEPGKLVPVLLELKWLDRLTDGTYKLHDWEQTNTWAADAENRSDKARLSGMARNYPELHKMLVAKGATGITKDEYVKLTTEYNSRGIIGKDKQQNCDLRFASDSLAPAPKPAPVPNPEDLSRTEEEVISSVAILENLSENTVNISHEINNDNKKKDINVKENGSNATEKNIADKTVNNAKSIVNSEDFANSATQHANADNEVQNFINKSPATIEAVINLWNDKLTQVGFPHIHKITPARGKMFIARIRADEDRKMLSWWIQLFDKMLASDFMLRVLKNNAQWLTIDWVLEENNLVKIVEGRYDDKPKVKATKTHCNDKPKPVIIKAPELTPEEIEAKNKEELETLSMIRKEFERISKEAKENREREEREARERHRQAIEIATQSLKKPNISSAENTEDDYGIKSIGSMLPSVFQGLRQI